MIPAAEKAAEERNLMEKFVYYAPTEIVFGKDTELRAAEMVKKYGGSRVFVPPP